MLNPNQKQFISDIHNCDTNRIHRILHIAVSTEYGLPHNDKISDSKKIKFVFDIVSKLVKMNKLSYSLEEFFVDYANFKLFISTDNLIFFLIGKLRNIKADEFFHQDTFIKNGVEFI